MNDDGKKRKIWQDIEKKRLLKKCKSFIRKMCKFIFDSIQF